MDVGEIGVFVPLATLLLLLEGARALPIFEPLDVTEERALTPVMRGSASGIISSLSPWNEPSLLSSYSSPLVSPLSKPWATSPIEYIAPRPIEYDNGGKSCSSASLPSSLSSL